LSRKILRLICSNLLPIYLVTLDKKHSSATRVFFLTMAMRQTCVQFFQQNFTTYDIIQGGNFNWNKIHNLDVKDFCKKNPETGRFLFFLVHILAYMVVAYLLPEVHNFFFSNVRVSDTDTSFEHPLRKEYNALFVS
jgi:hypothetical protein